ncbi:hypothetical protein UY3_03962 [Chelonia mydas]|uniref:Uncharacterized protein n=1 Tax=Chelonia mydas TaxID=8469 RepID=M7C350_CHEMY|nr:hypothetical protein UY3_03962 [Chelonia mydas]
MGLGSGNSYEKSLLGPGHICNVHSKTLKEPGENLLIRPINADVVPNCSQGMPLEIALLKVEVTGEVRCPVTIEGFDASVYLTPRHDGFEQVNSGRMSPIMGSGAVEVRADGKVLRLPQTRNGVGSIAQHELSPDFLMGGGSLACPQPCPSPLAFFDFLAGAVDGDGGPLVNGAARWTNAVVLGAELEPLLRGRSEHRLHQEYFESDFTLFLGPRFKELSDTTLSTYVPFTKAPETATKRIAHRHGLFAVIAELKA